MLLGLLDLLYPPRCPGCREMLVRDGPFCRLCAETLVEVPELRCVRCGEPEVGSLCGHCLLDPPVFTLALAPFLYGGALADAIHRFKYEDAPHYGLALAGLMAFPLVEQLVWADVLAPVPLHVRRLRSRGYDQALVLARHLARVVKKPVEPRAVRRVRETESQVGKDRWRRKGNVDGAFLATPGPVRGRKVLLVDDVLTTGATANAAAAALLGAGAAEVRVVAVARAISD